ncbi:hypothetical protein HG531_011046 [Fusarium graminearum]|nr:hypothetical protein HG531_011046 [Fusarium graminearum]
MLPSLSRRWAMTGSRRESVMEMLPLLPGGLEPLMKAFTAAFRRCSSSISAFRRRRTKNMAPPPIPATITTPTTTPAAIAATLGPSFLGSEAASELVAVSSVWVAAAESPPAVVLEAASVDEGAALEVDFSST